MARFTSFINEKVSKKEIDEVLTATDVLVGAEFELKLNEDIFSDMRYEYEERVSDSENFDRDFEYWEDETIKWKEEKEEKRADVEDEAYGKFKVVGSDEYNKYVNDEMNEWEEDNPCPSEPEEPYNYLSKWDRDLGDFFRDLNFDEIENVVLGYLSNVVYNIRKWEIHEDSSLSGLAAEIVSPPMPLQEFLDVCPKIFRLIDKIGFTDNECGLHIGMSLLGKMDKIDLVKLILFTDENYVWKKFSGREVNSYVEHMQETIRKEILKSRSYRPVSQEERIGRILKLKSMIRENDIDINYIKHHYQGINAEHLNGNNPYIEFRYMGGREYHSKWNDVKNIIAHYAYNMKLSCDPNFKKKEYIAKCTRILNKLETWAVMIEIDNAEKKSEENMDSNEKQKYIKNLKKRLQFLPKLTNKEKDFMIDIGA